MKTYKSDVVLLSLSLATSLMALFLVVFSLQGQYPDVEIVYPMNVFVVFEVMSVAITGMLVILSGNFATSVRLSVHHKYKVASRNCFDPSL